MIKVINYCILFFFVLYLNCEKICKRCENMEDYYYRQIIEKSSFGYANHRIVLDEENNPIDYIFLEVNEAFEDLTGFKKEEVLGKSLKSVLSPDSIKDFDWVKTYSEVAIEGKELKFEHSYVLLFKYLFKRS